MREMWSDKKREVMEAISRKISTGFYEVPPQHGGTWQNLLSISHDGASILLCSLACKSAISLSTWAAGNIS